MHTLGHQISAQFLPVTPETEAWLRERITYVFHAVPYGWGQGKALVEALAPFEAKIEEATARNEWELAALISRVLLEEVLPSYQQVRLFDPDRDLARFLNRVARRLHWMLPLLLDPDEYAAATEALADVAHAARVLHEPLLKEEVEERG